MKRLLFGHFLLALAVSLFSGCQGNELGSLARQLPPVLNAQEDIAQIRTEPAEICPEPIMEPDKVSSSDKKEMEATYIDLHREFRDISTGIVVKNFFSSPETIYEFMKLVYQTLDQALAIYKTSNGLDERSIYVLFKGGNVLRMIANKVFDMLPPAARDLLKQNYADYFQRSDADFSIYVDEAKLQGLSYDNVINDVTNLTLVQLNTIRVELEKNPQKYFDFMRLRSDFASAELYKHFIEVKKANSTKDEENKSWYNVNFTQLQLLDDRAVPGAACFYQGQYDFKFELKDNKIITTRISDKPHWIVISENRNLEGVWGSDPSKKVKFYLVRSKVGFEYTFLKDGKLERKNIGGELIDVSIPHKDDARLRDFLDNYDRTVAAYTLKKGEEQLSMKAYSLANLAEDLQFIVFDSFNRPWDGGKKYNKRINRLFFLFILEMIGEYGVGSERANEYLADVKEKILDPVSSLYPLTAESPKVAEQLKHNAELLLRSWGKLPISGEFWLAFAEFIDRLVKHKLDGDKEGLIDGSEEKPSLLKSIQENMDVVQELGKMPFIKLDLSKVYEADIGELF